jgi:hypothetical protein
VNKPSVVCRLATGLLIAIPVALVVVALGADFIGADPDQRWGPFRVGLLILGSAGVLLILGMRLVDEVDRRLLMRPRSSGPGGGRVKQPRSTSNVTAEPLRQPEPVTAAPSPDRARGLSAPLRGTGRILGFTMLFIGIGSLYVFLASAGYWTTWPSTSRYYDLLAEGFIRGQAALPIEPSPLLAELEDPYSPSERRGVPILYDASYYRGKYYLYWGPAPAAIAALWKLATQRSVGDEHIVFVSISSIFVFSMLIVLRLKKKFIPSVPGWLLATSGLILATSHPMLWVLNWPDIYPAAIASGQAFLLGGLLVALPLIDGSVERVWRLFLTGVLWSLAIGSRLTLILPVSILAIAVILGLSSRMGVGRRQLATRIAALTLPLVISAGLLGFYNHVRFGNVLETGLRYQLSKLDHRALYEEGRPFDAAYALPNTIYYLTAPLRFQSTFPFVRPLWTQVPSISLILERLDVSEAYHVEDITGLLLAMPTIVFAGLAARALLCFRKGGAEGTSGSTDALLHDRWFRRTLTVLLLAGLAAAVPTALYFWVSNRFFLDSVPLLAITACAGTWLVHGASRGFPLRQRAVDLLIVLAVVTAAILGLLLAFTGSWSRLDDLNPSLWKALTDLLAW